MRVNKSKIEWCDYTWNPVTGCLHGCPYCYAKRLAERGLGEYGKYVKGQRFAPHFHMNRLEEPIAVKKPSRIFVSSMGDLFGNWVTSGWINDVLSVAAECPQHTFIFLTKNPSKLKDYTFGENCWIGTSIENQEAANERVPELLKAPASVRFLSIEPLLGPVDLARIPAAAWGNEYAGRDYRGIHLSALHGGRKTDSPWHLNWVIIGAQTGPKAIAPEPTWTANLIDQCRDARTSLFLKDNLHWSERIQQYPKQGGEST